MTTSEWIYFVLVCFNIAADIFLIGVCLWAMKELRDIEVGK